MISFTMQVMNQVCPPGAKRDIARRGEPAHTVTWRLTAASDSAQRRSALSRSSA